MMWLIAALLVPHFLNELDIVLGKLHQLIRVLRNR